MVKPWEVWIIAIVMFALGALFVAVAYSVPVKAPNFAPKVKDVPWHHSEGHS